VSVSTGGGGSAYDLSIDDGSPTTATTSVVLSLYGTAAYSMEVSNASNFAGATRMPYATTMPWTLAPNSGSETVYVQFQSVGGSVIGSAQASIDLVPASAGLLPLSSSYSSSSSSTVSSSSSASSPIAELAALQAQLAVLLREAGQSANAPAIVPVVVLTEYTGPVSTKLTISSPSIPSADWHGLGDVAGSTSHYSEILWGYSGTISDSETITVDGGNAWYSSATGQCFSGVNVSSSVDQNPAFHVCNTGGTSSASCQVPSLTPTQGGELIVSEVHEPGINATWNQGFSPMVACPSSQSTGGTACVGTLIQTTAGTVQPTASYGFFRDIFHSVVLP
jgi:hypothetical protein